MRKITGSLRVLTVNVIRRYRRARGTQLAGVCMHRLWTTHRSRSASLPVLTSS